MRAYSAALTLSLIGCATPAAPPPSEPQDPPVAAPQPVPPAPAPVEPVRPAPRPKARVTGVRLQVQPEDAEIELNGARIGRVSGLADGLLVLKPGIYQLSLRREGYRTWRVEVSVGEQPENITVTLDPL